MIKKIYNKIFKRGTDTQTLDLDEPEKKLLFSRFLLESAEEEFEEGSVEESVTNNARRWTDKAVGKVVEENIEE